MLSPGDPARYQPVAFYYQECFSWFSKTHTGPSRKIQQGKHSFSWEEIKALKNIWEIPGFSHESKIIGYWRTRFISDIYFYPTYFLNGAKYTAGTQ